MSTIDSRAQGLPAAWCESARHALRQLALLDLASDIDAGAVRAGQIRELVNLTPWMMLGAVFNCTVLVLHFWRIEAGPAVLLWGACVWLFALTTVVKWHANRSRPPITKASQRSAMRAARHAGIVGALWGALPFVTAGVGGDMDHALVIITIVGMSGSGAIVLAVLPAAALAHIAAMLVPALVAMLFGVLPSSAALTLLVLNYIVVLAVVVVARYREFVYRLRDKLEIERQAAALAESTAAARRAAEAANEASRAKSQFLANMSHEIRTPMNGVLGMAAILAKSDLTEKQRQSLGMINQSGAALLAIINDVLDLSRIEAGRLPLDVRRFNLRSCLHDVISTVSAEIERKALTVKVDVALELPDYVEGDGGRLRQILVNLVGNAVKFTERGTITVAVEPEGVADTELRIRFRVADTGVGMPPETLSRLFTPFEQGDNSITRKFGGTGLGLSIARSLVQMMGGTIDIMSEVGRGTAVTFTVSLARAPLRRGEEPGQKSTHSDTVVAGLRVLVAEDNPVNQEVARSYLEMLGCEVRLVEDGRAAVCAHSDGHFDFVLMDCQMPEMDGLAATRAIRAAEAKRDDRVPIVAITANAFDSDRAACIAAGMDDFLSKPFTQEDLTAVLRRWAKPQAIAG